MFSFLTSLKDRLTSPLYASFIISWIPWNWKVFIGLVFYKSTNLNLIAQTTYTDYFDLIIKETDWFNSLVFPAATALLYTLLTPLLKWGITAFELLIANFQSRTEDRLLKGRYIPPHIHKAVVDENKLLNDSFGEFKRNNESFQNIIGELKSTNKENVKRANEILQAFSNFQEKYGSLNNQLHRLLDGYPEPGRTEVIVYVGDMFNSFQNELNEYSEFVNKQTNLSKLGIG